MTTNFTQGWLTLSEVAEFLRVSPTTVRRLITTGRLRANNTSWEEADDAVAPVDEAIIPIQSRIQNLLKAARTLEANDPKFEALRNIIRDKQKLPNNKVMSVVSTVLTPTPVSTSWNTHS